MLANLTFFDFRQPFSSAIHYFSPWEDAISWISSIETDMALGHMQIHSPSHTERIQSISDTLGQLCRVSQHTCTKADASGMYWRTCITHTLHWSSTKQGSSDLQVLALSVSAGLDCHLGRVLLIVFVLNGRSCQQRKHSLLVHLPCSSSSVSGHQEKWGPATSFNQSDT